MVTNVAPDHLGDYGIQDVESLADAKMVVTRALRHNSRLVLNANDPLVVERATDPPCPVTWISGAPSEGPEDVATRLLAPHGVSLRDSDDVWLAVDENIVHAVGDSDLESRSFIRVDEIPITFGGAALFNIYNAIGAISLARALRLPDEAIREGLRSFKSTPEQNVGRLNVYDLGSVRAIVDFAHNPHGMESVFDMVGKLAPDRWLVTIGQAGDRDDEEIRELARLTWAARPDRVVIKELPKKLRGREPGEVPRLIEEELLSLGATAETIDHADSDFDAVRKALAWAQGGDLLLLLLHEDRTESLDLLDSLESEPAR
jgi:UDP-N-acetylmuramyl tripeptide synthase